MNRIKSWIYGETWAIPLDIFRISFGILCITYFYSLLIEIPDFSSQNGLINHEYYLKHWWFLKINLIPSNPSDLYFKVIIGSSIFLSTLLTVGIYPRFVSFLLFLVAATVQRWNFAVMYVDDATIHLVLFWLILLPSGHTLNIKDYYKEGSKVFDKWLKTKISAIGIKLLLLNVCWIYFYAGMQKLFSEMWYEGFAMYPILLIPISRVAEYIKPEYFPVIKVVTYISLITEIVVAFFLLSKKGSIPKWIGLILLASFHIMIIATLRIPFANFALLGSAILFFSEELMDFIHSRKGIVEKLGSVKKMSYTGIISIVFFVLIITSTTRAVPYIDNISKMPQKILWVMGVIQDYKLFDWIYRLNYNLDYEVKFTAEDNTESYFLNHTDFFPESVRYTVFQLRLYDARWILHIKNEKRKELKKDVPYRIASKYCGELENDGDVNMKVTIRRITPDNIDLKKISAVRRIKFKCKDNKVVSYKFN